MIDREQTFNFVQELSKMILCSIDTEETEQMEEIYHRIKNNIPKAESYNVPDSQFVRLEDSQLNKLLIPFGFNLLLELAFILVVHCKGDVLPVQLKSMIIVEFNNILTSLVQSD